MFRIFHLLLIALLIGCPHLCAQMAGGNGPGNHASVGKTAGCCSKCAGNDAGRRHGGMPGKVPAGPGRSNCLCCGAVMDASRVLDARLLDNSPQSWLIGCPEPIALRTIVGGCAKTTGAGFLPPDGRELCLQLCALLI